MRQTIVPSFLAPPSSQPLGPVVLQVAETTSLTGEHGEDLGLLTRVRTQQPGLDGRRAGLIEETHPGRQDIVVHDDDPVGMRAAIPRAVRRLDAGHVTGTVVRKGVVDRPGKLDTRHHPKANRRPRSTVDVNTKPRVVVDVFEQVGLIDELPASAKPSEGCPPEDAPLRVDEVRPRMKERHGPAGASIRHVVAMNTM